MKIWAEWRGDGEPLLVLLHGLGATGAVWQPFMALAEQKWPGRILCPDLRGHGRSAPADLYGVGQHAADVAALIGDAKQVHVIGHSMGGIVALALASGWFGVTVKSVLGIGIKVRWTEEEFKRIASFAASPTRFFASREEAITRYLRVSGLDGLVDPGSDIAGTGVVEQDGRWRLAADQRSVLVGAPPFGPLLAAAQCPVTLARGEHDPMVSTEDLRAFDSEAKVLDGLGHNAHVEDPEALWGQNVL